MLYNYNNKVKKNGLRWLEAILNHENFLGTPLAVLVREVRRATVVSAAITEGDFRIRYALEQPEL